MLVLSAILVGSNLASSFAAQLKIDLKNKDKPDKPGPVLPPNLGEVLSGDTLRNYTCEDGELVGERVAAYENYKWFVNNILFCINFGLTERLSKQVKEVGYFDFISKVYSTSDEAFAILMVLNYEDRWRNQILHPADRKQQKEDPMYACKWTSSDTGFCKLTWKSEGIDKYNELLEKVDKLRDTPRNGIHLEAMIKKDFEKIRPSRKRKKAPRVLESRPRMGGALHKKLAALKKT